MAYSIPGQLKHILETKKNRLGENRSFSGRNLTVKTDGRNNKSLAEHFTSFFHNSVFSVKVDFHLLEPEEPQVLRR
jgi:hypothetical protein